MPKKGNVGTMDIVYGSFNDFEITFLPIKTAEYYAKLHTAHQNGITFAELYDQLPEFFDLIMDYKCNSFYQFGLPLCEGISCQKFYLKLFQKLYDNFGSSNRIGMVKVDREFKSLIDFSDYYQNELDLEDRLPLSTDKFNDKSLPFEILMEIINYEPRMDWAPNDIYSKLGFQYESIHDGDFTVFLIENESEVLQAFKDAGYNCIRNEKLIAQAFGQ